MKEKERETATHFSFIAHIIAYAEKWLTAYSSRHIKITQSFSEAEEKKSRRETFISIINNNWRSSVRNVVGDGE